MKKLLLLAILLINGSYLLSMEADKEEVAKFEFEELPAEIHAMIQKLGFDAAIESANSIQEAIQNIYAIKQVSKQWRDIWIDLMNNEQVTQYLLGKLLNEFSAEIQLSGFEQLHRKEVIAKKNLNFREIFGNNYYLQQKGFFADPLFILLLLGTDGAIKLLQSTNKLYGSKGQQIHKLIKAYESKNPQNIKTIAHLKDVAHKAFGFEQYAQLSKDIQKIIASYGLDKSVLNDAINSANTVQEAIKNIYELKLNPAWKYAWDQVMKDEKITNSLLGMLTIGPVNEIGAFRKKLEKDLMIDVRGKKHLPIYSPDLIMLLLGTEGIINQLKRSDSKDKFIWTIKHYASKKPENIKTIERLQSTFEKAFGHRVDLSDVPKQ